jgi:hypothetical protein
MFIVRPEYYKMDDFEDGDPAKGLAEIMIQKNRHGPTDNIRLRFQSQYTKFTDIDEDYHIENPSDSLPQNEKFNTIDASFNNEEIENIDDSGIQPDNDLPY